MSETPEKCVNTWGQGKLGLFCVGFKEGDVFVEQ